MQREFRGTFGNFLAMKRKEADLTIKDMANRLKISTAYYSYFESGDRKAPERNVQDQIADILELTPSERLLLYDLAGKTRGIVAADLPDYINDNPYVRVALRRARDSKASMEQWLSFIRQFDTKPEAGR
jgi:transcriptional regulator with XRE-family HTH domain